MGKIILASSSPRRADILKKLDINFDVIPSNYVEEHDQTVFSYAYIEKLAYNKAFEVAKRIQGTHTVIGSDTMVIVDDKILGKPKDRQDAIEMLNLLSNKTHFVVTAISVINSRTLEFENTSTKTFVTFESLSKKMIEDYVDNFKPYDKAGAYGIQELPKVFIKTVEGSLDNVIGLPSKTLIKMLEHPKFNRF